jgi:hypothetical protein
MSGNRQFRIVPVLAAMALGGILLSGCQKPAGSGEAPAAAPGTATPFHLRATVDEIMDSMVMPAADVIWNSTAVVESTEGERDMRPKTDDDWKKVERAGVVLSEALNSLMIPGRPVNKPGAVAANPESELAPDQIQALIQKEPEVWVGFAQALDGTVEKLQAAIRERNFDKISDLGGELDETCENCHLHFWYPKKD